MTGNQMVSAMFDVKTFLHEARIVSVKDWNEDPKQLGIINKIAYPKIVMEYYLESRHRSTLYVWWLCSVFEVK